MSIANRITEIMSSSSWIRKMFEEGTNLKKKYGTENVFDFSIGNPDLTPPKEFQETLLKYSSIDEPGFHGYMSNAGYPDVRTKVADFCSQEQNVPVSMDNIIMSCGAGGGLNTIFKSILNPQDEVIVSAPYFVEYGFYVENHGGKLITVKALDNFDPDLVAIEAAITPKTAALLINSPNNPTGKIYSEEIVKKIGELLKRKSKEIGRTIYLVSDEPYRKISYEKTVPAIFPYYDETILVTSYSKDLSIPGERIGWIGVNPKASEAASLVSAITLCTRILGFVNAPAIMQRVVGDLQGLVADVSIYRERRDFLCDQLEKAGYTFIKPDGAFYLFVKAPGEDDLAYVNLLKKENILTVPGMGFGYSGYFRISFCVSMDVIKGSIPGFNKVITAFGK